jgi:hypothetical protein
VKGFTKVDGAGEYLPEWRSRNWCKLGGGPIANLGLWQRLIAAVERHSSVRFEWTLAQITSTPTASPVKRGRPHFSASGIRS